MLAFCNKCSNIMVLKRRAGRLGMFVCRSCNAIRKLKVSPIELKEEVKAIIPRVPGYY